MDRVDTFTETPITQRDRVPINTLGVELTPDENEKIILLEQRVTVGNADQIKAQLKEVLPEYYLKNRQSLDDWIKTTPAGLIPKSNSGVERDEIFINLDNVDDPELIPLLKRHEAVEAVTDARYWDIDLIAAQIGIKKEIIEGDLSNDPSHYIAMYHEFLLADKMGLLKKDLQFRQRAAGLRARDIYKKSKNWFSRLTHPDWKQNFKKKAGSMAETVFLVPKMIAEKIIAEKNG